MTLQRWKSLTEWPLAAAAVVFLAAYAWTVISNFRDDRGHLPEAVMNIVWVLFVVDYLVSLYLAKPRRRWFLTHLHELLIVALPFLRPLRLLRLVERAAFCVARLAFCDFFRRPAMNVRSRGSRR